MTDGNGSKIIGNQLISRFSGLITKIANIDPPPPILITGETGTGKSLLARAIHNLSARSEHPFVCLNCGAIPRELMESELYGHSKGSFTGAHKDRRGKFIMAGHGTLFLDEIGELPLDLQANLLHVLDDNCFYPVGSEACVQSHCAVICATNQDLSEMIRNKSFRPDLYYRINVIRLNIPPLRERPGDIIDLLLHFIAKYRGDNAPLELTEEAVGWLQSHSWPGNVREVENCVQRLCFFHEGGPVTIRDVISAFTNELGLSEALPTVSSEAPPPKRVGDDHEKSSKNRLELVFGNDLSVDNVKRGLMRSVLERCGGNTTRASEWLGLFRTSIGNYCKRNKLPFGGKYIPLNDNTLRSVMFELADYVYCKINNEKMTWGAVVHEVTKALSDPGWFPSKGFQSPELPVYLSGKYGDEEALKVWQALKHVFGHKSGGAQIREKLVRSVLESNEGNVINSADLLGLSKATIYNICDKYEISYGNEFVPECDERLSASMHLVAGFARDLLAEGNKTFRVAVREIDMLLVGH